MKQQPSPSQRSNRISSVDRAAAYIEQAIDRARSDGCRRLPALRDMAARAGVSLVTMWKAAQRFIDAGTLYGARRAGLIIADAPPSSEEIAVVERSVWRATATLIERDILNRRYGPGVLLPAFKELRIRYAVSYQTLRKALDDLTKRGVILTHKRGFAVPAPGGAPGRHRIALVTARRFARDNASNELSLGILGPEHLRQLEIECSRAGICLDVYSYSQEGDRVAFCYVKDNEPTEKLDGETTLGFIWLITGTEQPLAIDVRRIMLTLTSYGKPLAIFSELAEVTPAIPEKSLRQTRLFPAALTRRPGIAVGRFLLGLGHRRIAYLSPWHSVTWSSDRLAGLRETFEIAAGPGSVTEYSTGSFANSNDFFERASVDGRLVSLRKSIDRWKQRAPGSIRRHVSAPIDYALRVGFEMGAVETQLQPFFEEALGDPAITAWVAANDVVAEMALTFLKQKGVRVPKRLSIVSFDDSSLAAANQLTSFDFNLPAYITSMLGYILKLQPYAGKPADIEGWIVERATTAPPGRS